jgi:nucleoside-diphosphate-sugar epimerase
MRVFGYPCDIRQMFNIACSERITLNRVIEDLRADSGCDIYPIYADERPGEVRHSLADITLARECWAMSRAVGFRLGLERTYRYYEGRWPPVEIGTGAR